MRRSATRLKLLVVSDVGGRIERANQLCEAAVCSTDCDADAVLVSGGFVAPRGPHAFEALEAVGCAEGDMTALVSRLEMIICRVIYIPDDHDPPTTRSTVVAPPSLTQYSSNVYSKAEQLVPGVLVMGEAYYFKLLNDGKNPVEGQDLVLVLRDSAVRSRLPPPKDQSWLSVANALLWPTRSNSASEFDSDGSRYLEIIGGGNHDPHLETPLLFPGSLREGQYAVLELEKLPTDGSWVVRSAKFQQLPPLDQ